ncbi:hypothetical protein [Streptomyces piniterrae]|uniref:hypothetical protein n=1 Tax=Streptomyces piniterrae TaxID=2571125 RepID=UPI00145EF0FD|nr:hypothetical protein [Streptomyces piniterrae]
MTVSLGAGVFIAVASLGIVLIYGPAAAPAVALAVPLALAANRSHLSYRAVRWR